MNLRDAQGALAIWHDIRAGREEEFEFWYKNEHLPERLGVPGFRLGRRFEAVSGTPRFFCYYLTDTPETLKSGSYIERLNSPTPLTREMMTGVFANMIRTVCRRADIQGHLFGSFAVTARMAGSPRVASDFAAALAAEAGVARCEIWTSAESGQGSAAEEALRGSDRKVGGCIVAEVLRAEDAERVAGKLTQAGGAGAEVGIYRFLCEHPATRG